jgi:hypothetical protein
VRSRSPSTLGVGHYSARSKPATPSQAESPSAPEAIEDQQQSGGLYWTLSLIRGTLACEPEGVYSRRN